MLQDLAPHLLHEILRRLDGRDLANLECCCRSMRDPCGVTPLQSKALTELVAHQLCLNHPWFHMISAQILDRLGGSWKAFYEYLTKLSTQSVVAAGHYHTLVIKQDGSLVSFGSGDYGVLGHGEAVNFCQPSIIRSLSGLRVTQISATFHHAALVTHSGEVFTFGDNSSGCCGHELGSRITVPTPVPSLSSVPCKQVATGLSFTLVLTQSGELYSFGSNSHGQLGHGDTLDKFDAEKVESLKSPIIKVSAGRSCTLAVAEEGHLFSFGYGGNFCLGHARADNELQPRPVETFQRSGTRIVDAVAGSEHCIALDSRGQVFTWGKGYCGALGHGDEQDCTVPEPLTGLGKLVPVQVHAGHRRSFVVGFDGRVLAFGWVQLDGKVLQPESFDGVEPHKIARVSSGHYHTIFSTTNGVLLGIGDNEKGQLGCESLSVSYSPEKIYI